MALKAFSYSDFTKRAYRGFGNCVGGKKRKKGQMPGYYLDRIGRMLRRAETYGVPKHGDRLIELGTGWVHWEAITTRLFFNVSGVLFDVWDNRQIGALKSYLSQLHNSLDKINIGDQQKMLADDLIMQIIKAENYEGIYKIIGFDYVVNKHGTLDIFKKNSFDIVVSAGVLEHISATYSSIFVQEIASIIKPGGYSIHDINIRDHLFGYDNTVSPKQYLRYSEWVWKNLFENDVQYINRIQRSDWLKLFGKAGLLLVEEEADVDDLSGLRIAQEYQSYDKSDLHCVGLKLVHRKPLAPLER